MKLSIKNLCTIAVVVVLAGLFIWAALHLDRFKACCGAGRRLAPGLGSLPAPPPLAEATPTLSRIKVEELHPEAPCRCDYSSREKFKRCGDLEADMDRFTEGCKIPAEFLPNRVSLSAQPSSSREVPR